jgi:hypothetical protein
MSRRGTGVVDNKQQQRHYEEWGTLRRKPAQTTKFYRVLCVVVTVVTCDLMTPLKLTQRKGKILP